MIPVLFLSYNRLAFTKQSLARLLETPGIVIHWFDNGSTDGTREWAKEMLDQHGKITALRLNAENAGMNYAVNWFVRENPNAQVYGKLDNDTIPGQSWAIELLHLLVKHDLTAVSAWHWRPEGPAKTWWEWTDSWPKAGGVRFGDYCGGTAVMWRRRLHEEIGLCYEEYDSMLGDLTLLFRLAARQRKHSIAWAEDTFARLLDLQYDNGPITEGHEGYDAEIAKARQAGNAWWCAMGGVEGITSWIERRGGREKLGALE